MKMLGQGATQQRSASAYRTQLGQGAIESSDRLGSAEWPTRRNERLFRCIGKVLHKCGAPHLSDDESDASLDCRHLAGQGATEYLVLLAVVLIVALVSVALLGFFPGMASDAQATQSKAYWQSAQPISIIESAARAYASNGATFLYLRIRNTGAYSLRITGIVGADGAKADSFYGQSCAGTPGTKSISDYFYMAPGEEKYLGYTAAFGTACDWQFYASTSASASMYAGGASSACQNSTASPGTLSYKTLGFEYIEYIDGQQITKRQIGKEFIVKCREPV